MTDLEPPQFDSLTRVQQIGWGARYAWRGARIVALHPALWGYVLAPVALMTAVFVFGSGALLWLVGVVTSFLWVPSEDAAGWVHVAYTVALWSLRLVLVGGLLLTLYFAAGLVATPFNDRLSDHVERKILRSRTDEWRLDEFLRDLFWSVTHSALSLSIYLVILLVLLLVNLLPGIGSLISFVLGALVSSAFFTREAMDGSLSRRRMGYVEKWRTVAEHWPLALGFGLVVSAAMWIPLLNFLVLPMSVAGGTTLYCHLEQAGRIRRGHEAS